MKILLAPDKFKGSLTAQEVCTSLAAGIKKSHPNATIISKPLADGGDGSLEVLDYYLDLKTISKIVQDPLGRPINTSYKLAKETAYIEMAAASGLVLLQVAERNCLITSSYGTGELIADAIAQGATKIYLFIGGSATNDGGIGIAAALGYQFYDGAGQILKPVGENLKNIAKIDNSQVRFDWNKISVRVICDVENPFYGKNGAAYVYAAQKGASPTDIVYLDKGLRSLANQLVAHNYPNIAQVAGAGAAGGVGGGAIAFLGAKLQSGIQTFMELTQLETAIKDCDIVITGEGKLDKQTEQGKVISGVCQLAKKYNKRVLAVCGAADFPISTSLNLERVYTIINRATSLEDAMTNARIFLLEIGSELLR